MTPFSCAIPDTPPWKYFLCAPLPYSQYHSLPHIFYCILLSTGHALISVSDVPSTFAHHYFHSYIPLTFILPAILHIISLFHIYLLFSYVVTLLLPINSPSLTQFHFLNNAYIFIHDSLQLPLSHL